MNTYLIEIIQKLIDSRYILEIYKLKLLPLDF